MITKHQLIAALFTGGPLIEHGKVLLTIVNAVEREDGSNRNYNVSGYLNTDDYLNTKGTSVFVRTID